MSPEDQFNNWLYSGQLYGPDQAKCPLCDEYYNRSFGHSSFGHSCFGPIVSRLKRIEEKLDQLIKLHDKTAPREGGRGDQIL